MLSLSKINDNLGMVYILLRKLDIKISSHYAHLGKTEPDLVLKPYNSDWDSNLWTGSLTQTKPTLGLELTVF